MYDVLGNTSCSQGLRAGEALTRVAYFSGAEGRVWLCRLPSCNLPSFPGRQYQMSASALATRIAKRRRPTQDRPAERPRGSTSSASTSPDPRRTGVSPTTPSPSSPFGGRPAEEVLLKLVEHAKQEDGYSIWGAVLVDMWLMTLSPGQRVPFVVTTGVKETLRGLDYCTYCVLVHAFTPRN
jgi:hypothetical protein